MMSEYSLYSQELLPRPAQPATIVPMARPGNIGAIIGRVEEALDQETAAVATDMGFDLKASNARKSRCLYELSRALKGADEAAIAAQYDGDLKRLRSKLARNEAALKAHLAAVGEVAGLLQDAIRRAETDGTYSAGAFG